jgi:hypothetical protein
MAVRKRTWNILGGGVAVSATATTIAWPVIAAEYDAPATFNITVK